jgi:hypothetical protein
VGLVSIGKNPSVGSYPVSHRGVEAKLATYVSFDVEVKTRDGGTETVTSGVPMVRHDGQWRRLFFEWEYPEWLAGRCGSLQYPGAESGSRL